MHSGHPAEAGHRPRRAVGALGADSFMGRRPEHRQQAEQRPGRDRRRETDVPFELRQTSLPDSGHRLLRMAAGRRGQGSSPTTSTRPPPMASLHLPEYWPHGLRQRARSSFQTCIITTGPNEVMAPIHDRMPVILQPEQFDAWLDPENHDTAALTGDAGAMPGPI